MAHLLCVITRVRDQGLLLRDWVIALAAAASILLAVPVFVVTSRRLSRLGIRRQDMQAEAGARMIEFVQGLAVIRAFNRLAQGQESFRRAIDDFRDISILRKGERDADHLVRGDPAQNTKMHA